MLQEEGELRLVSLERSRLRLEKASQRITELEEGLQGKQAALDSLASENALLKSQIQVCQAEFLICKTRESVYLPCYVNGKWICSRGSPVHSHCVL